MLIAAKMPLFVNVHRHALATSASIVTSDFHEATLREWTGLLDAVRDSVSGLERAIEHAWMERLLYEQEQSRAEQEAVAEIERARNSRRPVLSPDTFVNAGVLIFTVLAVLWAVSNSTKPVGKRGGNGDLLVLAAIAVGFTLLAFAIWRFVTQWRGSRPQASSYDYEISLRLDEPLDAARVADYLRETKIQRDRVTLHPRGGVRVERVSPDATIVKLHSTMAVRYGRFRVVHFEIVNEILVHRASDDSRQILRELRIYGDSPRALLPAEVVEMAEDALTLSVGTMVPKGARWDPKAALERATGLLTGTTP